MAFNQRHFGQRFLEMGDEAENIFEEVYEQGFVRIGLNRPPIHMASLPPVVRHIPDYLTSKGFVEAQGFGRDGLAKFKVEKVHSLRRWHDLFRVDFFLWDSHTRRYGWVRMGELLERVSEPGVELKEFHDGPKYWAVPLDVLPVVGGWVEYGDKLGVAR